MSRAQQLLTYEQVAERLQCSKKTVQRMVKEGIPGKTPREPFPVVRLGRLVRFHPSDVDYVEDALRVAMLLPVRRGPHRKASAA